MTRQTQYAGHRTPKAFTICPDCQRHIGVQPDYNHNIADLGARSRWRLAVHHNPARVKCSASRMYVDAAVVMPTKETTP